MTESPGNWWTMLAWRPPLLIGERLRLRPLVESDAEAVFAYASNPNMTDYTLWETHRSIAESLYFVREYAHSRYREREPEPLAIVLNDDPNDCVIGTIGCFWVSRPYGIMELGYAIGESYWGNGFTTEAARLLITHVFAEYAVERIQGRCMEENQASARVLIKLGMQFEGTLRRSLLRRGRYWNLQYFAVLRDEWENGAERA